MREGEKNLCIVGMIFWIIVLMIFLGCVAWHAAELDKMYQAVIKAHTINEGRSNDNP